MQRDAPPLGREVCGIHRALARPVVRAALLLLAAASLSAFGIAGIGRGVAINRDMHFLFVAGKMWLHRESPYPLADYVRVSDALPGIAHEHVRMGFAYPPTIAPLCLLLGAGPLGWANVFMVVLNIVAVGVTAFYTYEIVRASLPSGSPLVASLRSVVPALVVGNPFTAHIVYCGQTTLLATAALVAGWYYSFYRPRPVLAGVLFALCTIKPQVVVLALIWIVLRRQWKQLSATAVGGALLLAVPLAATGPVTLAQQWLAALRDYEGGPIQSVGFQNVFGIQSLFVASGLNAPRLAVLALVVVAWLWWERRRIAADDLLALLLGASCLFVYAHDYDLAALAPLFACVWKRSAPSNGRAIGALAFLALMFAPQRFVRSTEFGPLIHWREIVLLGGFAWLLAASIRAQAVVQETARAD